MESEALNLLPAYLIIEFPEDEPMADLDMYAETLIYAYEHPQHRGRIDGAEAAVREENISCGDVLTVYMSVRDDTLSGITFDGAGCVISMGSADLLAGFLKGKKVEEVMNLGKEELLGIIGIDPGPVRMHCATLSLRAVKKALFEYKKRPLDFATKEL